MTIKYVGNQTFAGAMDVGAAQAGFELIAKLELPGGFGSPVVEANRGNAGLPDDFIIQASAAGDGSDWPVQRGAVVLSNPPCSGFSVLSAKDFRGIDSPINKCMNAAISYAAACDAPVFAMESVQQAFWKGLPMMRALREQFLSEAGRKRMYLTHVLHDAFECGSSQTRKRYYMVLSRQPFDVIDIPRPTWAPNTLRDVIADLQEQPLEWDAVKYVKGAPTGNAGAAIRRQRDGLRKVDGHMNRETPYTQRVLAAAAKVGGFAPTECAAHVVTRYYDKFGELPEGWAHKSEKILGGERHGGLLQQMGFNQLTRWDYDSNSRVITGGATQLVMHPEVDRTLTHREACRIMGFPDSWLLEPVSNLGQLAMYHGKQVTVDTGRWIAQQVGHNLGDTEAPGEVALTYEIGERETVVDLSRGERGFDERKYRKMFGSDVGETDAKLLVA